MSVLLCPSSERTVMTGAPKAAGPRPDIVIPAEVGGLSLGVWSSTRAPLKPSFVDPYRSREGKDS